MKLSQKVRDWLVVIPAGLLAIFLIPRLGEGRAFAVAATLYVFYAVISHKWNSRNDKKFWMAIAIFTAIHVIGLVIIPFPGELRPALIGFPFVLADGLAMWAILNWLEKRSLHTRGAS